MMWQAGCVGSVEFKLKMGSGQKKVIQISLKQIGSTHKFSHEFFKKIYMYLSLGKSYNKLFGVTIK